MKRNWIQIWKIRRYLFIYAAGLFTISANAQKPKQKTNLLFIWTDEQNYFTMKAYGNNVIKTPALDSLADESFVFEKAYVTQPVCSPSRGSVMTGMYPHTHGITTNNIPLDENIKTLPEIINDSAYSTAYIGKWHLGNEIFAQQGFQTWRPMEDGYDKYYSPDKDTNARSDYHHWLVEKGYQPNQKEKNKFSRSFAAKLPLEHCKPKFLEEKTIEFLEENKDKPFIAYVNFLEPHMPFYGPLDSLYSPDEVILPPNFYDSLDEDEPLKYRLKQEFCQKKYGHDEKEYRELIARYWGLVTQVDMSVGAILNKLEEMGIDDNTIVVFTSDHGDMMGAHKLVEKSVMFEESVRVPLLLKVPGINKSQKIIQERVSHIDLVPTLLDLMGTEIPEYVQGKSLVPVLKGNELPDRDVFIEWNVNNDNKSGVTKETRLADEEIIEEVGSASVRTIISKDGWKLALNDKDNSQLFDLNNDPLETTNLFYDPKYKEKVKELTAKIKEWQKKTNDTLKLE